MAYYTYEHAIKTAYDYLNIDVNKIEIISDTNKRGIVYGFENEKIVIFIYPISCKKDNSQSFFDTRDSGAKERAIAWHYAKANGYRYFCLGFNEEQERYKNYVFSLESDEATISNISFRKAENTDATGTQVNIPNSFIPSKAFERIRTPKGFYISAIRKDRIGEYLRMFDNRPYASDYFDNDNVVVQEEAVKGGINTLYYGVPGAGKSHMIDEQIKGASYERVVFHPDYTYSDFVGQIMPKLKKDDKGNDKLSYEFVSGPFTKAIQKAVANPNEMFYLVIEEINRGNAPAIFGDVFQLLDREDDGAGKYTITNFDIAREVHRDENKEIRMPSNLSIFATMNTSDQNIFTLDTAFQRRWNMQYVKNDIDNAEHATNPIEGSSVTWGQFANVINQEIVDYNAELSSIEDKQLGAYFVKEQDLKADKFPEKTLKYLWDDAFKLERGKVFKDDIKSIGDLVGTYSKEIKKGNDPIERVMKEAIYERMKAYKLMMDKAVKSTTRDADKPETLEKTPIEKEN